MPDLTITPTSVVPGAGASVQYGYAGETLTAGQAVYLKAADGRIWKAQADGTAAEAACVGVTLNGASVGQTVGYVANGPLTGLSATTVKTTTYLVSAAAGGICPQADIISTQNISIVGWATDAAGAFIVRPFLTGAVV